MKSARNSDWTRANPRELGLWLSENSREKPPGPNGDHVTETEVSAGAGEPRRVGIMGFAYVKGGTTNAT
jgi:hypothetical protein